MAGVVALAAGCSGSSGSSAVGPQSPAPIASTSTAGTSAATSSAGASGTSAPATSTDPGTTSVASTSAAPTTTAAAGSPTKHTPATSSAPATTATGGSGSTAINPQDPAVKTAHAWFAQVAKAINAKKYETPALDALMAPVFRTRLKVMFGSEIGSYYPGPFPSEFLSESSPGPGLRNIQTCDVLDGYAQNPKTHKPAHSFVESAGEARVELRNGRWVMLDWIDAPDHHSCKGVKVATPSW